VCVGAGPGADRKKTAGAGENWDGDVLWVKQQPNSFENCMEKKKKKGLIKFVKCHQGKKNGWINNKSKNERNVSKRIIH